MLFVRRDPNHREELADKAIVSMRDSSQVAMGNMVGTIEAMGVRNRMMVMEGRQQECRQDDRQHQDSIYLPFKHSESIISRVSP